MHARWTSSAAGLPDRSGNAKLALRLNQASHWFPPPILWLLVGVVALVVRSTSGLALATPAIAALVVLVLSALAIPSVPHYAVPVAPAFVLLAGASLLGPRRPR